MAGVPFSAGVAGIFFNGSLCPAGGVVKDVAVPATAKRPCDLVPKLQLGNQMDDEITALHGAVGFRP